MRIKSSFHDYYDVGMSLGMADDLLFIREEKLVKEENKYTSSNIYEVDGQTLRSYHIGFCGKFYGCMLWRSQYYYSYEKLKTEFTASGFDIEAKQRWAYGFDNNGVRRFFYPENQKSCYEQYIERKPRIVSKGRKTKTEAHAARAKANREKRWGSMNTATKQQTIFELYDAPIVICGNRGETHINGCLNKYQFQKVMDPYTAYQTLFQYLANKANPDRPIPTVSNSDLIEAKGFNLKTSFRKEKSKP